MKLSPVKKLRGYTKQQPLEGKLKQRYVRNEEDLRQALVDASQAPDYQLNLTYLSEGNNRFSPGSGLEILIIDSFSVSAPIVIPFAASGCTIKGVGTIYITVPDDVNVLFDSYAFFVTFENITQYYENNGSSTFTFYRQNDPGASYIPEWSVGKAPGLQLHKCAITRWEEAAGDYILEEPIFENVSFVDGDEFIGKSNKPKFQGCYFGVDITLTSSECYFTNCSGAPYFDTTGSAILTGCHFANVDVGGGSVISGCKTERITVNGDGVAIAGNYIAGNLNCNNYEVIAQGNYVTGSIQNQFANGAYAPDLGNKPFDRGFSSGFDYGFG